MRCKGCGQIVEEPFDVGDGVYCSSDCHLESSEKEREMAEWDALGEDYD